MCVCVCVCWGGGSIPLIQLQCCSTVSSTVTLGCHVTIVIVIANVVIVTVTNTDGTIIRLNLSLHALLMDFDPYTGCQTSVERQCSISATGHRVKLQSYDSLCKSCSTSYHIGNCLTHRHTHPHNVKVTQGLVI